MLRSAELEHSILGHFKKCEELNNRLGKKMEMGDSTAADAFNKVLSITRRKLTNYRANWAVLKLKNYLYELMPENQIQLQMLPSFSILVGGKHEVKLHNSIRSKNRPRLVKQRNHGSMHKVEQLVDRMERIRSQLEFEDWGGNFFNSKLWLVIECLEQQIETSFKSFNKNF